MSQYPSLGSVELRETGPVTAGSLGTWTLIYTVGDVARRTRLTDPPVRSRQVRSVLFTLMAAGELIHADGNPVRKESATFAIKKDAEELLRVLRGFYVKELLKTGEKLDDSSMRRRSSSTTMRGVP